MSVLYSKLKKSLCLNGVRSSSSSHFHDENLNYYQETTSEFVDSNNNYIFHFEEDQPTTTTTTTTTTTLNPTSTPIPTITTPTIITPKPKPISGCFMIPMMLGQDHVNQQQQQPQSTISLTKSHGALIVAFLDKMQKMNETILIPSILKDLELTNDDQSTPSIFDCLDMLNVFHLLNTFKNSLIYSSNSNENWVKGLTQLQSQRSSAGKMVNKGMKKELSVDSGYSSILQDSMPQSLLSSSANSSIGCPNEEMSQSIETSSSSSGHDVDYLMITFFQHLHGLNSILEQLIEAAQFITSKYQEKTV